MTNIDIKHLHEHGFLDAEATVIALLCAAGWDKDGAAAVLANATPDGPRRNRKWTDTERHAVKAAYEGGTPIRIICATFGITKGQLAGQVACNGWLRPTDGVTA
jgi:hypothetical protein